MNVFIRIEDDCGRTIEYGNAARESEQTITVDMPKDGILNRPIGEGIELKEIMKEVASHYIIRAFKQSRGNKTMAAKLLGLPSYQTLSNWMTKYKVTYGRNSDGLDNRETSQSPER